MKRDNERFRLTREIREIQIINLANSLMYKGKKQETKGENL